MLVLIFTIIRIANDITLYKIESSFCIDLFTLQFALETKTVEHFLKTTSEQKGIIRMLKTYVLNSILQGNCIKWALISQNISSGQETLKLGVQMEILKSWSASELSYLHCFLNWPNFVFSMYLECSPCLLIFHYRKRFVMIAWQIQHFPQASQQIFYCLTELPHKWQDARTMTLNHWKEKH